MLSSDRRIEEIGRAGEKRVSCILRDIPNSTLLTNLLIPHSSGTSEIDAVLVTAKCIFLIEVKNYASSSIITGSKIRFEWQQTIKRRNATPLKRRFYNPIRQSKVALTNLVTFLRQKGIRIQESHCHSIIVFNSGCTLKKVPPPEKSFTVTQEHLLRSILLRRTKARKALFSPSEIKTITQALQRTANSSKRQKKKHIALAKRAEKKRKEAQEKRRQTRARRVH